MQVIAAAHAEGLDSLTCTRNRPVSSGSHCISFPLDKMLRVICIAQQIMTEFNSAASEKAKMVVIKKIILNLMNKNGHYNHVPLKVVALMQMSLEAASCAQYTVARLAYI
jgi:hypothetical protein